MIFLADAGVDLPIVEYLRQQGHTVYYVAEMQPGLSDDLVLELSNQAGALLVTIDKDFGELVFRQGCITTGVILIRLFGLSSGEKVRVISNVLERHVLELGGAFTVITHGAVRIRSHFRE